MKLLRIASMIILITAPGPSVRAEFTKDEFARMKNGEILFDGRFVETAEKVQKGEFIARIYIKADRKAVWEVVRDYENMEEYTPRLQKATILKKEGETYYLKYDIKILWFDITYYPVVHGTELYRRIDWETDLTQDNDIAGTTGYWLLEDAPDGSGTILNYVSYVDIGFLVPLVLAKVVAKKNLSDVIGNMKKRIESGGTWKKPKGT